MSKEMSFLVLKVYWNGFGKEFYELTSVHSNVNLSIQKVSVQYTVFTKFENSYFLLFIFSLYIQFIF